MADTTTAVIAASDILLKLMGKLVEKGVMTESEVVSIVEASEKEFDAEGTPEGQDAAGYIRTEIKGALGLL